MKIFFVPVIMATVIFVSCKQSAKINSAVYPTEDQMRAQPKTINEKPSEEKSLFIDVHNLQPGKVSYDDVMAAHQKDLAVEGKYDVDFKKFWFNAETGKVYCLASAKDSTSVIEAHREAHGLLPSAVYRVTSGAESVTIEGKQFFLDVHNLGAGNVTAGAVAKAHVKDLAVEKKYGVNFINYWVDVKNGTIFCLSEAPDSNAVIQTHREAHGLLPAYVLKVYQGQ